MMMHKVPGGISGHNANNILTETNTGNQTYETMMDQIVPFDSTGGGGSLQMDSILEQTAAEIKGKEASSK